MSTPGFDHTVVFQFKIDPGNRVRINLAIHGELPDRREAIARPQFTTCDCQSDLERQLRMQGYRAFLINLNHRLLTLLY